MGKRWNAGGTVGGALPKPTRLDRLLSTSIETNAAGSARDTSSGRAAWPPSRA